ncbi:TldD/PmbA family protein [Leptolyngbya sp. FACHB-261]|uniref:TldD/PmbA family protein n=1 Tax=Leptolyngbya sp. FACHB-261 TaxID=2692806 RepID=UPI0016827805|nr:TldD/PmbA family protein [Leptolyngbya sp. FACHB-261]MBD2104161.1 TldD/PmbA family protein [Leptolyngbya sp. FACHB-261]
MSDSDLSQRAQQLLELARQQGAEAAEVYLSTSQSRPVYFEANRLKQLESLESEGIALRLWKQGRPGLAVAYGPVEAQTLVDKALALSALNEPEDIELAEARTERYPDLGEAVPVETLLEWGRESIERVRQAYPEVVCSSQWTSDRETTYLINSNGFEAGYADITLSSSLGVEWVRGEDFLGIYDGQTDRQPLDPKALAELILQRLRWAEENTAPPQGKVPILLTSKAVDLLFGTVQSAINAKQVLQGASPWGDRLGELVASEQLTLSQEPQAGPFSCPFDDEGTPTRSLSFLEQGVLQNFYTDRRTARDLKQSSTGNGFRPGLGSYPTPGLFNLVVQPGTGSLAELIAGLEDGLIVDQVLGNGAGISGDLSLNVDLGYRVKQGQIVGRVKDTMVAGNIYTALKQILRLGGDADWNGSLYAPSMVVGGLSVTGRA